MKWLGYLLWLPAMLIRFALIVIGWFAVALSLVADGAYHTPKMWRLWAAIDFPGYSEIDGKTVSLRDWSRWDKYVWFAWRNPTVGLAGVLKQPIPEIKPNPDDKVRGTWLTDDVEVRDPIRKATRFMQHGIFWEYWSLTKMGNGKYWEFRIGWKFVDGNDHFYPTLQLGPKR